MKSRHSHCHKRQGLVWIGRLATTEAGPIRVWLPRCGPAETSRLGLWSWGHENEILLSDSNSMVFCLAFKQKIRSQRPGNILLMEEILHQLIGSFPHYLQGFIHPRWLFGISSINSINLLFEKTKKKCFDHYDIPVHPPLNPTRPAPVVVSEDRKSHRLRDPSSSRPPPNFLLRSLDYQPSKLTYHWTLNSLAFEVVPVIFYIVFQITYPNPVSSSFLAFSHQVACFSLWR